jgi:hypothetical protein
VTNITLSKNFIVTSHVDGSYEIRINEENEKFLKKRPHDTSTKIVKADLSYNENYVISVGTDGTMFVCELFPQ